MTRLEAEPPYALRSVPAPPTLRLTDFREADFVPIGAGYGGLLTAIDLAHAARVSSCWKRGRPALAVPGAIVASASRSFAISTPTFYRRSRGGERASTILPRS